MSNCKFLPVHWRQEVCHSDNTLKVGEVILHVCPNVHLRPKRKNFINTFYKLTEILQICFESGRFLPVFCDTVMLNKI